jgi:hypothetical protein
MIRRAGKAGCDITGFDAVSLQPNAGSQGEYAGLLAIRAYHRRAATPSQHLPDPVLGARHQPGLGRDGGHDGRRRRLRQATATSTSTTSGQGRAARPTSSRR